MQLPVAPYREARMRVAVEELHLGLAPAFMRSAANTGLR
jgi:hypothetical protein